MLPSLEATISLHEGRVGLRPKTKVDLRVGLRLKTKVDLQDKSEKRIVRFPDHHSVNAKDVVKSIVVGLGLKCVWYSMTREDIGYNVESTIRELEFKGYPKSWWRNPLFKAVERSGCLSGAQVASLR